MYVKIYYILKYNIYFYICIYRESCILRFNKIWAAVFRTMRKMEGLSRMLRIQE